MTWKYMMCEVSEQYTNDVVTYRFQYSLSLGLLQMLSFASKSHKFFVLGLFWLLLI